MATKLYPASNVAGWHTDRCSHSRPLVKNKDGKKVPDPDWGVECDKCEAERRTLGWADDILEKPMTHDETRKAKAALDRAHLTAAQSQGLIAEILAKLVDERLKA